MSGLTENEIENDQNLLDKFILTIGAILSWAAVILVFVILAQVILRYGFKSGLIVLEELQWHLYAVGVMFGLSYAQVKNDHIRVDILYSNFSNRMKHYVDLFGILFLLLPFCIILFLQGVDFVENSLRVNERSDAPLGLCCRWAIKAVIPISISLLILAAVSRLFHIIILLKKGK